MELSAFHKKTLSEVSALLVQEPVETERLLLRPFLETDLEDLFEYLSQEEQRRLCGNPEVHTTEEAQRILDFFRDPSHRPINFAIVRKAENKVIGNLSIGLYPSAAADPAVKTKRGVSLSFVLNEKYWRQGYMTELLRQVFRLFFVKAELEFVNSGYFDFNAASAALHRKLGMKPWFEDEFERGGVHYHTKEMILRREDYLAENGPKTP